MEEESAWSMRGRRRVIVRWLVIGGDAVEWDEEFQVPQRQTPIQGPIVSLSKASTLTRQRTTIEQYPSDDVRTRESPAGDLRSEEVYDQPCSRPAKATYQATSVNAE